MINIRPFEAGDSYVIRPSSAFPPGVQAAVEEAMKAGPHAIALTICVDQRPIAIIGCSQIWKGVAEVWTLLSDEIEKYPMFYFKNIRRILNDVWNTFGLYRMFVYIRKDLAMACKTIKALGFEYEGTMRKFGPEGDDYTVWGRV